MSGEAGSFLAALSPVTVANLAVRQLKTILAREAWADFANVF